MYIIKAPLRAAMLARGERLAEFLNYEGENAHKKLLEQLIALQGLLDHVIESGKYIQEELVLPEDADRNTGLWCWWGLNKKAAAMLQAPNRKLAKYGWKVEGVVRLTRLGPPAVPLVLMQPQHVGSGRPIGYMLRDCLEDRALGRVRLCPRCAKWFVAVREDQQNCSKRCRSQCGVRSTPKKWAAYHRDRRKLETIRKQIEQLQTKLPTVRSSDRSTLEIEISRLTVEYKSLLQKKEKGQRHAKN
jgi:hypothetical protein